MPFVIYGEVAAIVPKKCQLYAVIAWPVKVILVCKIAVRVYPFTIAGAIQVLPLRRLQGQEEAGCFFIFYRLLNIGY